MFRKLNCFMKFDYGAGAVYVRNCGNAKCVSSCFENTRHPCGAQAYGCDSYGYNLLFLEINKTSYFEGSELHSSGYANSPLYAGGKEHFIFSNNNVSSHKECEAFRFISFASVRSQVETISFSQFGTFRGSYLFDLFEPNLAQIYSHLNVFNATTTSSFLLDGSHTSKNVYMSSCVFADIDPITTPVPGAIHFKSSSFTFPKSYLPSSLSFDPHCVFECPNPTTNRIVKVFNRKCIDSFQFTHYTEPTFCFLFVFHQMLS